MPNHKNFASKRNKNSVKLKDLIQALKMTRDFWGPNYWEPPDLAFYICDYMEKHPNKKLTPFLRRKLEIEFYRKLNKDKK